MAQQVIAEEVFEAMLDGAIDDLKLSGLSEDEMFSIVENNFVPLLVTIPIIIPI